MTRPLTVERLRLRRRLLFWLTLPVVLFSVFWAFKFLSLAPTAQTAISQYDDGFYVASEETSSSLLFLNVVEPYLPYFNRGTAYAADEYYGRATDDFEKALELAPQERKCMVRLSLALAWERFGDIYVQLGYYQGAVLLYEASQKVMDDAGDECQSQQDQQDMDDSKDRVGQKKQDAESQRDQQEQQPQEQDGQSKQDQQLEQLEQQQQDAAQEKADQDAEQRGEESGGYYVDKPW